MIRRIYNRIKVQHEGLSKNIRLSIAVNAVNNTAGPDGLVPTLLLFGAMPRIGLPEAKYLHPTQKERFSAMASARKEMETITAQRRVKQALKHRLGPDSPRFEFGDKVMVYREDTKTWNGPYRVHSF